MLVLGLACPGVSGDVFAHHNIERTYDLKREVRLEGKIRQLLLRNPHSFLQIEVTDRMGKPSSGLTTFFAESLCGCVRPSDQLGRSIIGDQVCSFDGLSHNRVFHAPLHVAFQELVIRESTYSGDDFKTAELV